MFEELDKVVLTHDIKEYNLKEGDRGTIVHIYGKGKGFEVEFFNEKGRTIAVLTLMSEDIRDYMSKGEYDIHDFNSSVHTYTSASRVFTMGAEYSLKGFDSIYGITEYRIKSGSEENHYSASI